MRSKTSGCGELLGFRLDERPLDTLVGEAMAAVRQERSPVVFACANPHSLVEARVDEEFRLALLDADQLVADGVGVILGAKLAGACAGPRITGSDYFRAAMLALDREAGIRRRVFLFGSSDAVLERMESRLSSEFPNVTVCGRLAPPFRPWSEEEDEGFRSVIRSAEPDILWVGISAPKQEKWVYRNRYALQIPVIGSVGAVFDFMAGTVPRAPEWMCRVGLEWLYRLGREPRRLWRRNLISTPMFIGLVIGEYLRAEGARRGT